MKTIVRVSDYHYFDTSRVKKANGESDWYLCHVQTGSADFWATYTTSQKGSKTATEKLCLPDDWQEVLLSVQEIQEYRDGK